MIFDEFEIAQGKKRQQPTPPEQLSAAIDDLYTKVIKTTGNVTINLTRTHPNDVINGVIDRLKANGWSAKHYFSDGYNRYDHLEVSPSRKTHVRST